MPQYTPESLKQGTRVFVIPKNEEATTTLVYKHGCCTVTGLEVVYDNGAQEYFPRHKIPTEIKIL